MAEEYISKSMLIEKIERIKPLDGPNSSQSRVRYLQWLSVWNAIEELPVVSGTIPIKVARWLAPDEGFSKKIWAKCSNCEHNIELYHKHISITGEAAYYKIDYKFCPECGAKIEENHNNE